MNERLRRIPGPSIAISLLGVVLGCIFAVLFVPDQVDSPDDLRASAIAFSIGILVGPLFSSIRLPENALHPTSVLLIGIVYWVLLDLVQARYVPDVRSTDAIVNAFIAVGLFSGGICFGSLFKITQVPNIIAEAATEGLSARLLFRLGLIAFVLGFLRFAIPVDFDLLRMYEALFLDRWSAPWARGAYGGWDAFLDHFAYFGYVLPALSVLVYRMDRKVTWRTITITIMAIIIIVLLAQGGGRRIIGALIASAGVVWILTARRKGVALFLFSVLGLPAILTYMQFILLTRRSGMGGLEALTVSDLTQSGISVDDNFNRLTQIVEIIPDLVSHVGIDWVIWILVRPIPRVLWPGKPEGVGFSLPDFLGMQGVSLTSSVVGESYMAFGLLGCLVTGILYGYLGRVLARVLDYRIFPGAVLIFGLGLLALFVGLRAAIELLLFSYPIMAWVVLAYIIRRKRRRRARLA